MIQLRTRTPSRASIPASHLLHSILEEVRLLRSELALLLPQEDLNGYAHPERIKRSYQKALKEYPPSAA